MDQVYNAFKNYYLDYGSDFEIYHYIHIIFKLINEGRIISKNRPTLKITYYDPCFLRRWNKAYDILRKILKSIKGIEFIEMQKTRKVSLCCGRRGDNFLIDLLGGNIL